jgi:aspartate/methionine/tyrosine aminotransferase/predicted nicotinamide N-methyase
VQTIDINEQIESANTPEASMRALEDLLARLDETETRTGAIDELHRLAAACTQKKFPHLMFRVVDVPGLEQPIRLFLTPAVFSPEMWGQTFAEGLLKYPEQFHGTRVVELGTGSGWISLVLLAKTQVKEVIGLDINPVAVMTARLNAWLNGTRPDGTLVLSQAGQPIVECFRAAESDLLQVIIDSKDSFDHIIGCIPQVLHPGRAEDEDIEQRMSERDLYDLSNYCFEQGILEDRFGLPLIARALEQSQLCLKPGGKVTLILGGRPGPHAIDSMFLRRGFQPETIWSRRIAQADDTDLASLVELEKAHGIQFHFFLGKHSRQSVSADTAVKLLKKNRQVYHDLLVYEAFTRFEKSTFGFVRNLKNLELDSLRKELDFSRMSEEQMSFLERLSRSLLNSKALPYPHERGDMSLRKRLASFLRTYCHTALEPHEIFVAPERRVLLSMILDMVAHPGDDILISQSLRSVYDKLFSNTGYTNLKVTSGNDDLHEIFELDDALAPRILVLAPGSMSRPSMINVGALFEHAKLHPERFYIIDDSENFDIDSSLEANMALRIASQMQMPNNVIFLYGLIKNTVCPDLELSFLVNAPLGWSEKFDVASELTYSRIPYPSQLYYEWLFDDLLSFPFPAPDICPLKINERKDIDYRPEFVSAANDEVFAEKPISVEDPELIRLDYGEFEHPVPDLLVKGLLKGFIEEPSDALPALLRQRVTSYTYFTRGQMVTPDRVVLGQGVYPILGALIRTLTARLGRPPVIAVPNGSYGCIYPTVVYHGAEILSVETDKTNGFLVTKKAIDSLSKKPDLLWLTQPNNPSGLMFDSNAVKSILDTCASREIYLFTDEIFFMLSDHRLGAWTPQYLSFGSGLASSDKSKYLFLADGTSKAFAAGGLRAGFMITPDQSFAHEIQARIELPPKSILRAWDNLYSAFLEEAPHGLIDVDAAKNEVHHYLDSARKMLTSQRDELLQVLRKHNLDDGIDTPYRGGLFVLAKLADQRDELARKSKLLINSGDWSRSSEWSRLCFSLPPEKWKVAIERLRNYLDKR